ncbi:MAG: IS1182 family transposase [Chloroflexi bacterium]|nr:IS1182 family transposase [Chloroflexota bacterium]
MSLNQSFPTAIPESTRAVAEGLLGDDSVHQWLGEHVHEVVDEAALSQMYHRTGRGGINPVLMSIVLILQFLEDIPDRQAAHMAVMRLDWKYALRQELDWTGFDYSSLCNFRKRLYGHGQEMLIFESVLRYLGEHGYVKYHKQRTDATHVLGMVETLSRLELVWETLRLAVGALLSTDAPWVLAQLPASFVHSHTRRRSDYRLGQDQVATALQQAGHDGFWVLAQLTQQGRADLAALPEVVMLKRVLHEPFAPPTDDTPPTPLADRTASGDVIASPHDPQVRFARKGKSTTWEGYKVQITETVDDDLSILTDIRVCPAQQHDSQALSDIQDTLIQRRRPPQQQYVDRGYVSGPTRHASHSRGIELRGELPAPTSPKPPGWRLVDFTIDTVNRVAICPQGNRAISFNPSSQPDVAFHVRFGNQCQTCPVLSQCTSEKRGRSLEIAPDHDLRHARYQAMQDPAFAREMNQRVRIESTISELKRAHGLRRCRYRGSQKLSLQAAFTATAANLKRLVRYLVRLVPVPVFSLEAYLPDVAAAINRLSFVFQQSHIGRPLRIV